MARRGTSTNEGDWVVGGAECGERESRDCVGEARRSRSEEGAVRTQLISSGAMLQIGREGGVAGKDVVDEEAWGEEARRDEARSTQY